MHGNKTGILKMILQNKSVIRFKGIVHHVVGDHEGGNEAINAATRSTVVYGTGIAAGIASGGMYFKCYI